ncbi:MAG: DUF2878 domain-containing protein [Planctomycetota bacterium]
MRQTPGTLAKVANFAIFQIVWFIVVLSAAEESSWIGILAAALWVLLHVFASGRPMAELGLIAAVTVCGVFIDQLAVLSGAQIFADSQTYIGFVPLWIAALWATFATTLNFSLSWMKGRYLLALILGAILGPIVYVGAEGLGALQLGDDPRWLALSGLSIEWAIMMPLVLWFARKSERTGAESDQADV